MLKLIEAVSVTAAVLYLGIATHIVHGFYQKGGFDPSFATTTVAKTTEKSAPAQVRYSAQNHAFVQRFGAPYQWGYPLPGIMPFAPYGFSRY